MSGERIDHELQIAQKVNKMNKTQITTTTTAAYFNNETNKTFPSLVLLKETYTKEQFVLQIINSSFADNSNSSGMFDKFNVTKKSADEFKTYSVYTIILAVIGVIILVITVLALLAFILLKFRFGFIFQRPVLAIFSTIK